MSIENGFFSKVQRREAWMSAFPEPGLTPAPWLIPIVSPCAKAKVWIEPGLQGTVFGDSLPYSWPSFSQPKLYFLVPLSGLQMRSSWIIWLAFSQNREPPISVYFPVSEGGGLSMGRLLGLLLKHKLSQSRPGFPKWINFPTSGRHLLTPCALSTPREHDFR